MDLLPDRARFSVRARLGAAVLCLRFSKLQGLFTPKAAKAKIGLAVLELHDELENVVATLLPGLRFAVNQQNPLFKATTPRVGTSHSLAMATNVSKAWLAKLMHVSTNLYCASPVPPHFCRIKTTRTPTAPSLHFENLSPQRATRVINLLRRPRSHPIQSFSSAPTAAFLCQ